MTADPAAVRWLSLGSILIMAGLVSQAELETALEAQSHRGGRLGAVLVELGLLTPRQIAGAIADQCRLDFVDLDAVAIEPAAVKLLPEQLARRFARTQRRGQRHALARAGRRTRIDRE
ncbi:MAG TPA: hypothetical protein VGQ84_04670, partial [Gaiellaceae bacterium]|nr:hypothetical protein [Gaiellaceae bacterium]